VTTSHRYSVQLCLLCTKSQEPDRDTNPAATNFVQLRQSDYGIHFFVGRLNHPTAFHAQAKISTKSGISHIRLNPHINQISRLQYKSWPRPLVCEARMFQRMTAPEASPNEYSDISNNRLNRILSASAKRVRNTKPIILIMSTASPFINRTP
jgi:hypothetical protein